VLHTHLTKDSVAVKANLDNYDGLTNLREHVQNIRSILELVTHIKLISHFSTNIRAKNSIIDLIIITQWDDENTRACLWRFNKEMISMNDLREPIITEAMINWFYNYSLWEMLYTLPSKNVFSIKHEMEDYIRVE
jgi:hypothetical protein